MSDGKVYGGEEEWIERVQVSDGKVYGGERR